MLKLTDTLHLPTATEAVLWDMDGVLIDSLRFDFQNRSRILRQVTGIRHNFAYEAIKKGFALSPDDLWRFLLDDARISVSDEHIVELIEKFVDERCMQAFPLPDGIPEALAAIRSEGLKMAVVSNNPLADIQRILVNSGFEGLFDVIVSNDHEGVRKKPHPDMYLKAAELLNLSIDRCVVVEDSLIGAEAGHKAGAYTIGVATGGATVEELLASGFCNSCHASFGSTPG